MSAIVGQRVGFGTTYGFGEFAPERLVDDVVEAEALGFDMFGISDHLHGEHATLETWTALTWAAAATERIEVMPNVLGLPYRAPAVTAKMAETLDRLSGGRLVLGLGSGGYDREFAAFGLPVRTPGQKVGALAEALEIIRRLWAEPGVSFDGEHYQAREARIEPRPAHPIPIWLGSYGPRSLRLTGALADGWIPSLPRLELSQAVAMRDAVRAAAVAAGRDPDQITCAANVAVVFDAKRSPTPQVVAGGDEAIAGQLVEIIRAGFTFLNVMFSAPDPRRRFALEVIPLVRDALAQS
ncbi:LLM class flavin-dependent oxidoreductase [Nonomuraea sp. NPDC049784]|uniref:LLM class flavin-dependent oxidoreductase n=1 Tax=Nonomuraea sp. NPDC049784 TaxID=3154361 RepID=UPI0033F35457